MFRPLLRSRRLVLGSSLLLAGVLALAAVPMNASAYLQWGNCYDDPAVFLDNGSVVFLGTAIHADASAVAAINYTLHVPTGVSVTKVVYFGPNASVETLNWSADNKANTYDAGTQVVAPNATYTVTAVMAVAGKTSSLTAFTGQTNQDLLTHLILF